MKLGLAQRGRATSERRGAILLLFALLTFVFFAIAGIVIDVGLANLAQAQMQAATDSAAIEGCRLRNFDEGAGLSHREKRIRAATLVRLAFDDDMYPTGGDYDSDALDPDYDATAPDDADAAKLMAGPGLRVSGGVGTWAANATLGNQPELELARLDDPRLETNLSNERQGDMVAGNYLQGRPPKESGDYVREDFLPAETSTDDRVALSFLVRMRRAGNSNPLDLQNEVSSSLPTLPIVFGLGSTIVHAPGEDWDPRRDGITVRATSIASARPAMRIGRVPCGLDGQPIPDHELGIDAALRNRISGLVPFYITRDAWMRHFRDEAWHATENATGGKVEVRADGSLHLTHASADFSTEVAVGNFMFDAASAPASPCDVELGWPEIVGRKVPTASTLPVRGFRYTAGEPAYIPIVQAIPDANGVPTLRVVAYGFAHIWPVGQIADQSTPPFNGTGEFVISAGELILYGPVRAWVAQDNASAILNSAADEVVGPVLSKLEWEAVLAWSNVIAYFPGSIAPSDPLSFEPDLARLHDHTYVQRGTVLAPALTR